MVSKIFIWSGTDVTSTTSVMAGWKRLSVPFGHSDGDFAMVEIIDQRARHRRLADSALVGTDQYDCRLPHDPLPRPQNATIQHRLPGGTKERRDQSEDKESRDAT
jgi:hypothetical protein